MNAAAAEHFALLERLIFLAHRNSSGEVLKDASQEAAGKPPETSGPPSENAGRSEHFLASVRVNPRQLHALQPESSHSAKGTRTFDYKCSPNRQGPDALRQSSA